MPPGRPAATVRRSFGAPRRPHAWPARPSLAHPRRPGAWLPRPDAAPLPPPVGPPPPGAWRPPIVPWHGPQPGAAPFQLLPRLFRNLLPGVGSLARGLLFQLTAEFLGLRPSASASRRASSAFVRICSAAISFPVCARARSAYSPLRCAVRNKSHASRVPIWAASS